jgi:hypothetical protein
MIRKFFLAATIVCMLASCDKDDDNTLPIINIAQDSYALPTDTLFPEGIAYNPKTGYFYTGSTSNGNIYQVNVQTGVATLFSSGIATGRTFVTGMKIDALNRLWICGGGNNKIQVLNLADGSLIKSWDTQALFGSGFINDCIIDGTNIYFTDSRVQKIYRANVTEATPTTLEEWLTFTNTQIPYVPNGTNANGIVNTADNKYLIIVVSPNGKLYRIEKATKAISEITINTPVTAGDGMYLNGSILYVSRNTTNLIWPVQMNADFSQGTVGTGFGTGLMFNTTIDKADKYFLVVNAQFNRRTTPPTPVLPFTVSRILIP